MTAFPPVAIRVSTAPARGRGHLARCLAIRRHLAGAVHWFVDDGAPPALLSGCGDRVVGERDVFSCALLAESLRRGEIAAALVDSYDVATDQWALLRRAGRLVALCDAAPYPAADLVVDPQPTAEGATCGPRFLAIDPGLLPLRASGGRFDAPACRVLVAFGAVDTPNRTGLALQALLSLGDVGLDVTVALGGQAPHLDAVRDVVAALPRARLLVDAPMAALYPAADIAVGSPGVSQAERMFCGIPTVLVPQNATQDPLAEAWERLGGAVRAEPGVSAVASALRSLYGSPEPRETMRKRGLDLVDGGGAERLAVLLTRLANGATRNQTDGR